MAALAAAARIRPLTARLLVARGIAEADLAAHFLAPKLANLRPPTGMADLTRAIERLVTAFGAGETIGVFGDYDVDGVTTAAILTARLARLRWNGGRAGGQPPRRLRPRRRRRCPLRGRRVPRAGHRRLRHERSRRAPGARARAASTPSSSITTSCRRAKVAAYALVNSRRPDDAFPFKGLAVVRRRVLPGGGAAHATGIGVRCARPARPGRARHDRRPRAAGRREPDPGRRRARAAVAAQAAGARRAGARAPSSERRAITAHDAAFRLTPRLNAAGRLGEAQLALDLLLAGAADAERLAGELDDQNSERQRVQELVWKEALAQATAQVEETSAAALVVGAEGWHAGVVGIIAARLVDRFARPAIAIGFRDGDGRGSARTIAGRRTCSMRWRAAPRAPHQVRRPRRRGGHEPVDRRARRVSATPSRPRRRASSARPVGDGLRGRRRGDAPRSRPRLRRGAGPAGAVRRREPRAAVRAERRDHRSDASSWARTTCS